MSQSQTNHHTDEIRQIQTMMVLFSCLPPTSKLREVLELALKLPEGPVLSRVKPCTDASFDGLKGWLESLWSHDGLDANELKLIKWQNEPSNIMAAVKELEDVETAVGIKVSTLPA